MLAPIIYNKLSSSMCQIIAHRNDTFCCYKSIIDFSMKILEIWQESGWGKKIYWNRISRYSNDIYYILQFNIKSANIYFANFPNLTWIHWFWFCTHFSLSNILEHISPRHTILILTACLQPYCTFLFALCPHNEPSPIKIYQYSQEKSFSDLWKEVSNTCTQFFKYNTYKILLFGRFLYNIFNWSSNVKVENLISCKS